MLFMKSQKRMLELQELLLGKMILVFLIFLTPLEMKHFYMWSTFLFKRVQRDSVSTNNSVIKAVKSKCKNQKKVVILVQEEFFSPITISLLLWLLDFELKAFFLWEWRLRKEPKARRRWHYAPLMSATRHKSEAGEFPWLLMRLHSLFCRLHRPLQRQLDFQMWKSF